MLPLKDALGLAAAQALARELAGAWPAFPSRRFTRGLASALEPLELLARANELASRLISTMPTSFAEATEVLYRALESPTFTGWITLPCGSFVARAGIDEPNVALPLLAALTPRWSSESAIRPFIERYPTLTYGYLCDWVASDDEHVRRLVSEGTRPRLPWAPQLRGLIADPSPNVPLLDALVDDSSPYVRRSVANHLNDIAKDHPALAVELARRWIARGDDAAWAVRHGLRTLVKRGDDDALAVLGVRTQDSITLDDLTVDRDRIRIGEAVTFAFTLSTATDEPVDAIVDYRLHYVGARGAVKAPKAFKLTRRRLEPERPQRIRRSHSFEHVSIRRIYPGLHQIDIQVNGRVLGSTTVEILSEE